MIRDRRVVVLGGGVIGVCAAYYLGQKGFAVTLVERGDIAAGSSYGNAGLIVPSHAIPLAAPGVLWRGLRWMANPESPFWIKPRMDPDLVRWLWRFRSACTEAHVRRAVPLLRDLSVASLALYRELAALPGLDFGFREDGVLMVFRTARALADSQHEVHVLQDAGIAVKVLDGPAARALEPSLREDVAGAVYFPDDAHLTPDRFVRGLAGVLPALGVDLRTGTEALGFVRAGARLTAVDTTRGTLPADEVVLATGSWSPELGRALGVRLPIQPAKGYSVTYEAPPDGPRLPMLLAEASFAVTPMRTPAGAVLRLGGTLELAGLDLSISRRRVDAIRRGVHDYLELPAAPTLLEVWRGLRPCTPDGLPMIGRPRALENLIVATGHAMIGISLGPVTGSLVAQLAAGETPARDLALLSPDRFRGGR